MKTPKISVIIPAYNHEKYVEEAIRSVLDQTVADFELIIVNDGSPDNSEKVIMGIRDERIRYFSQNNQGAHKAINRGIGLARGEFVSILNSDDVYLPDRFEQCLDVLKDGSLHAVFSHVEFVDGDGEHIRYKKGAEDNWKSHRPETSFKGENRILLDLLAGNFLVSTSNLFCRKSVFGRTGLFSPLRYAHDYDFFLKLSYHFGTHLIEKPLLKYRIHEANTIKENEAETSFEVGLVLSDFLMNHDLKRMFPEDDPCTLMAKFFHSVNPLNSEKMMMTLLLFGTRYGTDKDLFHMLAADTENPFRKACTAHFEERIEAWRDSRRAWEKCRECHEKLSRTIRKLSEKEEEGKRLWLGSQEAWKNTERLMERLDQTEARLLNAEAEAKKWWSESQKTWKQLLDINKRLEETEKFAQEKEAEAKKWWLDSQNAWKRWHETHARLAEAEKELERMRKKEKQTC